MMSTPRGRPPRKPAPCSTSQDTPTPKSRGDKHDTTFVAVPKPRPKPRSATLTPVVTSHRTDNGDETPVRRSKVRTSSPGAKGRSSSSTPSVNNSRNSAGTPAANRSSSSRAGVASGFGTPATNGRSSGGTPAVNGRGGSSTPAANGRTTSSAAGGNGRGGSTTPAVSSRSSCRTTSGGGASTPAVNGLEGCTTPSVNGGGGDAALGRSRVRGRHPLADDCSSDLESAEEPVTVQVGVRVRPLSDRERAEPALAALTVRGDATSVLLETTHHPALAFYYDHVFWSLDPADTLFHGQAQVYESMASPLLKSAFEGYNVCLLAYGQTGSGKTYSMMGKLGGGDGTGSDEICDLAGVIPRFCVDLFRTAEAQTDFHTTVEVSYYEIYQERIRDLLTEGEERRPDLRVREHPTRGPHVVGLTTRAVSSWPQMKTIMQQGNRLRATASTGMNNKSSRSHSVLCLNLVQTQTEEVDGETLESRRTSQASLVDLAGSERAAQAHTSGLRLREGALINKSLLTLGKVISALVDGGRVHIPYRESALTWLLRESLGGNARTAMLATISPSAAHAEETLSTLRYACKANQIVNTVHVNEDPRARIIRELRAELERLRQEQTPVAPPSGPHANEKCEDSPSAAAARLAVARLRRQLAQKELELRAQNGELEEARRRLADTPQRQQTAPPQRQTCAAVPFLGQVAAPSLVQLLPDSSLSETVAYPLPEGEVYLGGGAEAELRLQGLLLEPRHCRVARQGSRVTLLPGDGASYVNGSPAAAVTALQHGDRLVLAGEVYLRLQLPARPSLGLRPFADARAELARNSEQRLAGEQEALRARVRKELLQELELERAELAAQGSAQQHQLEQQMTVLQARLEELSAEQRAPQPARPPPERRPSPPDLSPFRSDLLEQIESAFGEDAAPPGTTGNSGEAAELDALITETNTLLRRLGAKATVAADLELAGGALRPAATVTDRRHGVCTSWDLATLRRKVALLRSLCEEAAAGGTADLSAVLDSRSDWQQRQQRRRSGRRCSSVRGAAAATEEGALAAAVAALCAPLVHRGADWQADSLRALLLSLQALSDSLTALQAAWQAPRKLGLPQVLLTALTDWRRVETAYAGWRRGRLPAAEEADSELERTDDLLSLLQNSIGFVYQGVSSGVASLVEQHLSDCGRLLGRFCRALGTAAAELLAEEDDMDAPAADPDHQPERVRLAGEVLQQYSSGASAAVLRRLPELLRRCADVERLISDVKHLPVDSETAVRQLAAARKLAVRLRSWLLCLQQQLTDGCDSPDPPQPKSDVEVGPLSAIRDALSLLTRCIQRHCDGRGLDGAALAEAARRLLRWKHQLGRADTELQLLGGELAAAAAALLQLCRGADPSAAPQPAERRRSPSKSCLRSGHSPVKRRVRWGSDDVGQ